MKGECALKYVLYWNILHCGFCFFFNILTILQNIISALKAISSNVHYAEELYLNKLTINLEQ